MVIPVYDHYCTSAKGPFDANHFTDKEVILLLWIPIKIGTRDQSTQLIDSFVIKKASTVAGVLSIRKVIPQPCFCMHTNSRVLTIGM